MNNMELQAEGPRCRLRGARSGLGKRRDRRVDQKSHDGSRGQQFVQQLQPLRRYLNVQPCHAGHVAAGSVKAGDKSNVNRVGPYTEDDWNVRCRCLRRQRRSSATGGYKYKNLIMNQLRGKLRQTIRVRLRPSILDVDVLTLYIACHSQPLAESSQTNGIIFG